MQLQLTSERGVNQPLHEGVRHPAALDVRAGRRDGGHVLAGLRQFAHRRLCLRLRLRLGRRLIVGLQGSGEPEPELLVHLVLAGLRHRRALAGVAFEMNLRADGRKARAGWELAGSRAVGSAHGLSLARHPCSWPSEPRAPRMAASTRGACLARPVPPSPAPVALTPLAAWLTAGQRRGQRRRPSPLGLTGLTAASAVGTADGLMASSGWA